MSIAILYTDSDAIRAAVGITDVEISDAMMQSQMMETQIKTAVYKWLPTHGTIYAAGTAQGATEQEVHLKDLLVMYCMYFGAVRVVEMIMAMRQKISDGKSQLERFDIDWLALLELLKQRRDQAQDALEEILNPSDGGPAYFGLVTPDYDPVTNV